MFKKILMGLGGLVLLNAALSVVGAILGFHVDIAPMEDDD